MKQPHSFQSDMIEILTFFLRVHNYLYCHVIITVMQTLIYAIMLLNN